MSVRAVPRARIAGKRLVPGRVKECEELPAVFNLAGAELLGDAAGFAAGNLCVADGVKAAWFCRG